MDEIVRPKGLGKAGAALWDRITSTCDLEPGSELVLAQLCEVQDRLDAVRKTLKREGLTSTGGAGKLTRKHPLCDVECKLLASFGALWKLAGLAADDPQMRGRGRPVGT